VVDQRLRQRPARLLGEPERDDRRLRHEIRIAQRGELDQADAVAVPVSVTSRLLASSFVSSPSSRSRPMKEVSGSGRFERAVRSPAAACGALSRRATGPTNR
jgi:hypothetical protein